MTQMDDDSRTKIFKIEIKMLDLSGLSRQLLVISDITYILKNERVKIRQNF